MLDNNITQYTIVTDDDLDGAVCALLVELAYPTSKVNKYYAGSRSDEVVNALINNKTAQISERFYIADVGITPATASRINNIKIGPFSLASKVVFRDHHINSTFLNSKEFKNWAYVDSTDSEDEIYNECGASLLFDVLKDQIKMHHTQPVFESIEKIVKDTKEYDTWSWFMKTENQHSLFLNVLFKYKGIDKFVTEFKNCAKRNEPLTNVYSKNSGAVNGIISTLNTTKNTYIKNASDQRFIIEFCGYRACVLYCDNFLSEIGNYICRDCENIDIAILWNYKKIGLRTNLPGINLPAIASSLGGNGRGMSASIPMSDEVISKLVSVINTKLVEGVPAVTEKYSVKKEEIPQIQPVKPIMDQPRQAATLNPASLDVDLEPYEDLDDEDDAISNVIDNIVSKGTDISDVKTIGVSPELDWDYEKAESLRRQNEEEDLRYQEYLDHRQEEDAESVGPKEIEPPAAEEDDVVVEHQPPRTITNKPNNNGNVNQGNKKKKKNFKPVR